MGKKWKKTLVSSLLVVCFVFCMGLAIDGMITSAQARDQIVVQTWGGQIDLAQRKAFYEPFEEETGIKVITVEAGTAVGGKLAAMSKSGNIEWDVITADYESYNTKYYRKGLLEKIDYNIVNNTQDLLEGSMKEWGVAQYLEGICLVYNKKFFPEGKEPKSYKDFFDVKKFPGPRAMHNWGGPTDNLSIALMADGLSPDECLPVDFDRAFKMMDKVKPQIKVWYTTGAQLVQALLDEEVVMAISTDGRAKQAIQSGAPIEIVWNQSFYYLAYNCVVKDTPMKEAAMRLIKFCNRPEQQAIFTNYIGYTTTNKKTIRYLHPDFQKMQSTHPDNIGKIFNFMMIKNAQWAVDNVELVDEKWNSWIAR
jgi:putative spermidine/putrescine transport system substrate-binding protein